MARPYTLSGLCIYLNASESWWKEFRKNKNLSEDFLSVISWCEDTIRTQKYEGAAVGAFNGNVISRDLGMSEKVDTRQVDRNGNDVPLAPPSLNIIVQTADAPITESEDE